MHNGEQRPFISWESVRSALDSLVYLSTARSPNPLEHLLLVDEFLTNPDFPQGPHGRQFALDRILVTTIEEQYQRVRAALGMKPPDPDMEFDAALAEAVADERTGNLEAVGWGLLYFRFVRSELGLSLDMLAPAIHADPRTLRRYQHHAIHRLTEQLIQDEWFARIRHRQRRLMTELPSGPACLYGREPELREMGELFDEGICHRVLVTGATGIGKTAFVQAVLREQIERGALDQLVWIRSPATAEFVRRTLIERLLPEDSSIHLREALLLRRVGIVLDGIESLLEDGYEMEALLEELNPAIVFLTSRVAAPLRNITRHIALNELNGEDTVALAGSIAGRRLDEESALEVHRVLGGNPLAVKLAAQSQTRNMDTGELYHHRYNRLSERLRRAWYIFALVAPNPVDPSKLAGTWPISQNDISHLTRHYLLDAVSGGRYVIAPSARNFVEQLYGSDPTVTQVIQELLDDIGPTSLKFALDIIEPILLSGWPPVDLERQRTWIMSGWREGVHQGHCANWGTILEGFFQKAGTQDIELMAAYGICLRRLSQWHDAETAFQRAIWLAGKAGAFQEQARVLLELSVVYRCQGRYEQATHVFAQVQAILLRHPDDDLADSLRLEQAGVAIDRSDAEGALHALSGVVGASLRLYALQSEAFLLVGDCEQCIDWAFQALEGFTHNKGSKAHIHSVLGRCYALQKNAIPACRHLELSATILEQHDDPFALARAQSNLAAMLIKDHDYDEAELLLERAHDVQARVGDQLGLTATEHNLRLLRITRLDTPS
jgi:tetratricopeptide (TPR) repeat protein